MKAAKKKKKCKFRTLPQNPEGAPKQAPELLIPNSPEVKKSSSPAELKFPSPVGVDVHKEGAQKALLQ